MVETHGHQVEFYSFLNKKIVIKYNKLGLFSPEDLISNTNIHRELYLYIAFFHNFEFLFFFLYIRLD